MYFLTHSSPSQHFFSHSLDLPLPLPTSPLQLPSLSIKLLPIFHASILSFIFLSSFSLPQTLLPIIPSIYLLFSSLPTSSPLFPTIPSVYLILFFFRPSSPPFSPYFLHLYIPPFLLSTSLLSPSSHTILPFLHLSFSLSFPHQCAHLSPGKGMRIYVQNSLYFSRWYMKRQALFFTMNTVRFAFVSISIAYLFSPFVHL